MRNYYSITFKTYLPGHKHKIEHTFTETYIRTHTQASNHTICIKIKCCQKNTHSFYSKTHITSYDSESHIVQSSTSISYVLP